jgi:putative endonuclease
MEGFYVYVLRSNVDAKFYMGFTSDILRRLEDHNSGRVFSTRRRTPMNLVYFEYCLNIDDATHREKYLKTTYGKRFIKQRIKHYLIQ